MIYYALLLLPQGKFGFVVPAKVITCVTPVFYMQIVKQYLLLCLLDRASL